MKTIQRYLLLILGGLGLSSGVLQAQTFNWGSPVFSDIVDSEGVILDNTFVFELGSFTDDFTPDETNTNEWFSHWQVFDVAAYNGVEAVDDDGIYGYFTSTATMNTSGTSDSSGLTPGAISFEGLDAFVWIRNSDVAGEGTEWSLTRADGWVFPSAEPDCCGNDLPIEWSSSDLTAFNTPVWGSQGGVTGGGEITSPGTYTLQTATFVPEPSSAILSLLSTVVILLRRRR